MPHMSPIHDSDAVPAHQNTKNHRLPGTRNGQEPRPFAEVLRNRSNSRAGNPALHFGTTPPPRSPEPLLTRRTRCGRQARRAASHPPIKPPIPTHYPLPFLHLHTHPFQHRQSFRPQRPFLVPPHTPPRSLDQLQIVLLAHLPRQIHSLPHCPLPFHQLLHTTHPAQPHLLNRGQPLIPNALLSRRLQLLPLLLIAPTRRLRHLLPTHFRTNPILHAGEITLRQAICTPRPDRAPARL